MMTVKVIVLLLTFLSFSHLNLANSDQFKESQPKFETSHYPWIEVPCAILVLALSTFLNLAIINYINDKSPASLSLPLILYRDSFCILMVSEFHRYNYFIINVCLSACPFIYSNVLAFKYRHIGLCVILLTQYAYASTNFIWWLDNFIPLNRQESIVVSDKNSPTKYRQT